MFLPVAEFVGFSTHVTSGGSSGIMSTASPELAYPFISQAKSRVETTYWEGKVV